jgi:hypothetical protein
MNRISIHNLEIILLVPFLASTACMDRELVRVDPKTETYILDQIVTSGSSGVDVLVMVDNSVSMGDEQSLLAQNFPELIRSLLQPEDAVNNVTREPGPDGFADHVPVKDLHLGVVSSDMGTGGHDVDGCPDALDGDNGVLQNEPNPMVMNCDAAYPRFLEYSTEEPPPVRAPGEEATEEIEKLANDFGCIATLGTNGCGFEQQLEAVLKALTFHSTSPPDGSGENVGFLRPDTILAVLFVTDEEDCSVDILNPDNLRIFDTTLTATMGPMNLRCMLHPEMIHPVERYVEAFTGLRSSPSDFVMGMIVGVPPVEDAPMCNGFAENLGGCLENSLMRAMEDPDNPGYMQQSCISTDPTEGAYPPRRFIELAQKFAAQSPDTLGENVYVHSICTEDYTPAITAITNKIHEIVDKKGTGRELEVVKDPLDPRGCTCMAECKIIETLPDSSACTSPKIPYDEDGDGRPDTVVDEYGQTHTLCEIPHARMAITAGECACCLSTTADSPGDCTCTLACNAEEAGLEQLMCGDSPCTGWWYSPYFDPDGDGPVDPSPTLVFTDVLPEEGSTTDIQCRSEVCPSLRRCGPAKCCDVNEYCYQDPQSGEMLCLIRPDVCDEYGGELWCPADIYGLPPSHQGVCCLDWNMDGILDMEDIDGDTLLDVPLYRCNGTECVRR